MTVKWRSNWLLDCDTEFRFYFLSSRLSELGLQSYDPATPPEIHSLLVLPLPSYSNLTSSLLSTTIIPFLTVASKIPVTVLMPSPSLPLSAIPIATAIEIDFDPEGLLLYLKSARYESGETTLVAWLPNGDQSRDDARMEEVGKGENALGRFEELVSEWGKRGGESSRDEEIIMEVG
jgi:snurportin-1